MPPADSASVPAKLRTAFLFALLLPCATGCHFWPFGRRDPVEKLPVMTVSLDKNSLVGHLNANAQKLQAWQSSDVAITVGEAVGVPIKLGATIAVERPRNFRLRARSIRGQETDVGSNDERFWLWMRESPEKVVLTAHHEDVHRAQQRMHIPFNPEWLMETLGVVPIDAERVTLEHTDPTGSTVDLFENRTLANGQPVRVVTSVDTRHGLVTGRALYNARGDAIARARILRHRLHRDAYGTSVVLPHSIVLEWPMTGARMTLQIGDIDVNPESIPADVWELPHIPDCPIIDIGA